MKVFIILCLMFVFAGCEFQTEEGRIKQMQFVAKYGEKHVRVCEGGFLIVRYFYDRMNEQGHYMVVDDFNTPIRCKDER